MIVESEENISGKLQKLLLQGIEMAGADFGFVQLYNSERKVLEVVAQSGFTREFLDMFRKIKAFDPTSCGRALGLGVPVMINDVSKEKSYAAFLRSAKSAGFRAVLSTPLFSGDEEIIGIISIHFRQPILVSDKTHGLSDSYLQEVVNILVEW